MFFHVTKRARLAIFAISIVDNLYLLHQQMEHNQSTIAAMNRQRAMRIKFHDHSWLFHQSGKTLPWSQRFFLIFLPELRSRARGDNESRKRRGEREKPLVTLASNLTFMQTTAVKRVKLLIKRVTNGNLANTCLSAAIFLSGGRPGEIMLWTNHLHLGGKEWFVNRGQAKACVNNGRQESRNKNTT